MTPNGSLSSTRERPNEGEETGKRASIAGHMSDHQEGEQEQDGGDAEMEDAAGKIMRLAARSMPGDTKHRGKLRGLQGQLSRMKEEMENHRCVGILHNNDMHRPRRDRGETRTWETIPGMALECTTSKGSNGARWSFGNKEDFDRAMKWVRRKEGLLVIGGPLQRQSSKVTT